MTTDWKFGDVAEERPAWGLRYLMVTHVREGRAHGICIRATYKDGGEADNWVGGNWIVDEDAKKVDDE